MTDESRLILGVDGGGTSTVAWLGRSRTDIIGRGKAGPSNARSVGDAAARSALEEAIGLAFREAGIVRQSVASACLGLAGFDRPEERRRLQSWAAESCWADRLVLSNDGDLVVAAGTPEGWGIGVIAGTGSIAVGRASDGRKARAGGWGPLIGDEGSSYAVALEALRLVARRADGRSPAPSPDPLSHRLCAELGIESPALIPSKLYDAEMTRARIAGLAPAVLEANDPEVASDLLKRAGENLAELVLAVSASLELMTHPFPLALAGSFLLGSDDVSKALLAALRMKNLECLVTRVPEPVRGALILAEAAL